MSISGRAICDQGSTYVAEIKPSKVEELGEQ